MLRFRICLSCQLKHEFVSQDPLPVLVCAQDLQDLQVSHGYDTVELRISFMRGLHPFYPPKVALIRPRMPAVLAGALASHPLLSLDLWDPWKPCEEWLAVLKDFIQVRREPRRGARCTGALRPPHRQQPAADGMAHGARDDAMVPCHSVGLTSESACGRRTARWSWTRR